LSRPSNKLLDRAILSFEKTGVVPDGPMGDILRPLLQKDTAGQFISPKTMQIGRSMEDISNGTNRAARIVEALDAERKAFEAGEITFKQFRSKAVNAATEGNAIGKIGLRDAIKMEIGLWGSKSPVGIGVNPILEAKIKASQDALRLFGPRSSVQLGIPMLPFLSNRFPTMFGLTSFSGSVPIARLGQAGKLQKVLKRSHGEFVDSIKAEIAATGKHAQQVFDDAVGGVGRRPGADTLKLLDTARQSVRSFTADDMKRLGSEFGISPGDREAVFDDLFVQRHFEETIESTEDIAEWERFKGSYAEYTHGNIPGQARFYNTDIDVVGTGAVELPGKYRLEKTDAGEVFIDNITGESFTGDRLREELKLEGIAHGRLDAIENRNFVDRQMADINAELDLTGKQVKRTIPVQVIERPVLDIDGLPVYQQTVVAQLLDTVDDATQTAYMRQLQAMFPDAQNFALHGDRGVGVPSATRFINRDELRRLVGPPAMVESAEPKIWMSFAASPDDAARFAQQGPRTELERLLDRGGKASPAELDDTQQLLRLRPDIRTGEQYEARVYRGIHPDGPNDPGWYGKGTYYSIQRETSETYATQWNTQLGTESLGRVDSGRMVLKNPLVIKSRSLEENPILAMDKEVKALLEDIIDDELLGLEPGHVFEPGSGIKSHKDLVRDITARKVTTELKRLGYDGLVIRKEANSIEEVVSFYPQRQFAKDIPNVGTLLPELPPNLIHLRDFMDIDWVTGTVKGARIPLAAISSTERDALMRAGWIPNEAIKTNVNDELRRKITRWKTTDGMEELERVRHERAILANEKELTGKQIEDMQNIDELPIITEEGLGAFHNSGGLGPLQRKLNDINRADLDLDEMEEFLTQPEILQAIEATDNIFGAHMRGEILDHYNGLAGVTRRLLFSGKAGIGQDLEKIQAKRYGLFYEKRSIVRPIQLALNKQIERLRELDPSGLGIGSTENVSTQVNEVISSLKMQLAELDEWHKTLNEGMLTALEGTEPLRRAVVEQQAVHSQARLEIGRIREQIDSIFQGGTEGLSGHVLDDTRNEFARLMNTLEDLGLPVGPGEGVSGKNPFMKQFDALVDRFVVNVPGHEATAEDFFGLLDELEEINRIRLQDARNRGLQGIDVQLPMPPVSPAFQNRQSVNLFTTKKGETIFIQFDESNGGQFERMLYESKPLGKDAGQMAEARAEYAMAWLQRTTGLSKRKLVTARTDLLGRIEGEITAGTFQPQDINKAFKKVIDDLGLHGDAQKDVGISLRQSLTRMLSQIQKGEPMRVSDGAGGTIFNPALVSNDVDNKVIQILTDEGLSVVDKPSKGKKITPLAEGDVTGRVPGQQQDNFDAIAAGALEPTGGEAKGGLGQTPGSAQTGGEGRIKHVDRGIWGREREEALTVRARDQVDRDSLFEGFRIPTSETKKVALLWGEMGDRTFNQLTDLGNRIEASTDAHKNALHLEELLVQTTQKFDSEIQALTDQIKGAPGFDGKRVGGIEDKLAYKIVDKIARAQDKFVEMTRVGRRGTRVVENVQELRATAENQLTFMRRTIFRAMELELQGLNKRLGSDFLPDEIHGAVTLSMLENYEEVAMDILKSRGADEATMALDLHSMPLPDDEIWQIKKLLESDERTRLMLQSPEVKNVAVTMARTYTDFLLDLQQRGLMHIEANPTRMYLPLQFEDAAKVAANARLEEMGQTLRRMSGIPSRASVSQKFFLSRATNRMQLPKYAADGTLLTKNGNPVMSTVYTGQVGPAGKVAESSADIRLGDTAHDFERSRELTIRKTIEQDEDFLREYEKIMGERPVPLSGDKFDVDPRMQGAQANGPRWMPRQHMSSPQHLNKNRDPFIRLVGEDFTGPIFRTDPMLAFSQRIGQQLISTSTDSFVKSMRTSIKSIPEDEFKFLQQVPGKPNARLIDGVAYRTLNESKVRDSKVRLPLIDPEPGTLQLWPDDVASEYENLAQILREEDVITTIGKAVDTVNSLFKQVVLFLPRWTVINILGSTILSKMAGAEMSTMVTEFRPMWKAVSAAHGMGPMTKKNFDLSHLNKEIMTISGAEYTVTEILEEAILDRVVNSGRLMQEIMPALAAGDPGAKMIRSWARANNPISKGMGQWFKWNAAIEDFMRLSTYVSLRNQGFGRAEAASQVTKYMYDYGDLSLVEKKFGTRLWPFFRWMRNNIGLQMHQFFAKPRYASVFPKLLNTLSEATEDENSLPTSLRPRWIRDQMALSVIQNKQNAVFLNLNSLTPAQEIFEIGQGLMGVEGLQNFARFYLSATNPILKNTVELATGQELFTRFGIGDPKEGNAITMHEWMGRQTGVFYELFNKVPKAGRFNSFFAGRQDPDEPTTAGDVGASVGRFLIGGRVQSRDVEKLIKTKRFEEGDRTQRLRFALKRAVEKGDRDTAERLALEYVSRMRVLWDVGMADMVPKVLKARFRREDQIKRQEAGQDPFDGLP
ncbi:MAG: hypothetical protein JRE40_03140, partial [Deltaproteobacteria bacterium]|nr:hypothetical protein [Deltaproteobacteria bacterium]